MFIKQTIFTGSNIIDESFALDTVNKKKNSSLKSVNSGSSRLGESSEFLLTDNSLCESINGNL